MKNPLLDKDFLLKVDNDRNRVYYIKLIALDFEENPIEEINGRVTSGSINVDGTSSVRRTCSLSLVANELNIHAYYWGLNTKFKCYIGLENKVDNSYPNPIYFPMGTFLITSFNTSQSLSSYTISISGKDKMCLLNGDIGGNITAISVDFGQETEQQRDGSLKKTKLLIKDIIRESVHEYAREPYHNIIINDLDEAALELIEYQGKDPLYLSVESESNEVVNQTLNSKQKYFIPDNNEEGYTTILVEDLTDEQLDHRINLNFEQKNIAPYRLYGSASAAINSKTDPNQGYYTIVKCNYGDVVGYRLTDLTYAGDLIGNIGESLTSILDKIKNMLGDYEYFYNLEGQFVWQRKPTYINVSWNNLVQNIDDELHGESAAYTSATTYSFENHNLISSFTNSPNLSDVKNDYSIFGVKTMASGKEYPVHLRYAIDKKPTYYRSYDGYIYSTEKIEGKELSEMAEALAKKDIFNKTMTYPKQPLPPGLDSDWWDVWDWGEYYKMLTGDYPDGIMEHYRTATTNVNLDEYFFLGDSSEYPNAQDYSSYKNKWGILWESKPLYLFDAFRTVDEEGHEKWLIGFTGHNGYCGHKYKSYFMDYYEKLAEKGYEFHSYFYKPRIPQAEVSQINQEAYEKYIQEVNQVVDWREIIYQMARDYMKHGMTDKNNYEAVNKEDFTQAQLQTNRFYIKKENYVRAYEYIRNRTYYYWNEETEEYKVIELNKDTDFTELPYYYKETKDEYIEVEDASDVDTQLYQYVDFLARLKEYNLDYYPTGVTGYEQYYTDIMSFWRELYDPEYVGTFKVAGINKSIYMKEGSKYCWFKNQEGQQYQPNTVYYTKNLYNLIQAHKNVTQEEFYNYSYDYYLPVWGFDDIKENEVVDTDHTYDTARVYYTLSFGDYYGKYKEDGETLEAYPYWNKSIFQAPEDLNFWFDFLDNESVLSQYSVQRIGHRPKAENNTDIKAVYYRETPNVIFIDASEDSAEIKAQNQGYTFITMQDNVSHLFNISTQRQSCNDKLNTLLYQNAVCTETISITAVPIYYLQPNTRIFVTDVNSGINGEYIVTRISYTLSYNGTMNITATKAIDRIY